MTRSSHTDPTNSFASAAEEMVSVMEDKLEPIAVIGMSCRFPGDGGTIEGFWDLLKDARTAWSEVPESRFNVDSHYHPSAERQGAIIARGGYFSKEDPGNFDAPFFSMTSTEAAGTDPQQRWLLEVAYEAFENAGIPMKSLIGSKTSCYIGCFNQDYDTTSASNINVTSTYQATGSGLSMLANRLSWFYDLRGPSMVIDTACSSSLIALHLACQSIRSHESSMAIVGGTNMMIEPEPWRGLSTLRFLSPDGKSHSFDAKANGYGRGEGQAVIVLKPLSQALKDGDTIRSVIRGSGINQDGKTSGITVPNSDAQRDLIISTYASAGIGMDRTNYFEAHGTGTPVGDPLELAAVGAAMKAARSGKDPLLVGSVKPNIGHQEGGAGVAGIIKSILSMENGVIPAVAEFETLNPRLKLEQWGVAIPTELTPWPPGLRRVSVNSFGYGGTNAHAIMDDAYHYLEEHQLEGNHVTVAIPPSAVALDSFTDDPECSEGHKSNSTDYKLFSFSTPNQGGANRVKASYATFLKATAENKQSSPAEADFLHDLAYTLNVRRTVFDWRSFVVADSSSSLLENIEAGFVKLPRALKNPACGFVFTGQGAQWHAMGRELQAQPVFLSALTAADCYLNSLGSTWSLLTELNLSESESRINEPELSQAVCTALQIALVDLLTFWNVHPKAVVGHSSGEIAAAYSAGFLSREDAWKIAYFRGLYSSSMKTTYPLLHGTMTAVALAESSVLAYLKDTEDGRVCVGCINSPSSVTLSGDESAMSEVEARLQADGVWFRRLKVAMAYHSHHMQFVAEDYRNAIKNINPISGSSDVTMFSSLTGSSVSSATDLGADYWVENMVNAVRFSSAVTNMLKPTDARSKRQRLPNLNSLVEIGPHGALQGPLNQIMVSTPEGYDKLITYTTMLRRGQNATRTALETAGRLWGLGHNVDLTLVNAPATIHKPGKALVNLPSYPWNHDQRYWFDSRVGAASKNERSPRTDLLGLRALDFNQLEPRWHNYLKPLEIPWVLDHKVQGAILLPASAMMAMALEAMGQLADAHKTVDSYEMRNVRFTRALMFQTPDHVVQTSFQMRPSTNSWNQFTLFSANRGGFIEHCNGLIRVNYATKASEIEQGMEAEAEWLSHKAAYAATKLDSDHEVDTEELYHMLVSKGFEFGPTFRNLSTMSAGVNQGCATITIPDTKAIMPESVEFPLLIHPTVLDAALQIIISGHMRTPGNMDKVPTHVENIVISNSISTTPGTVLHGFCTIHDPDNENISASAVISDQQFSKPLLVYTGMKCASPARAMQATSGSEESSKVCSELVWVEDFETLTSATTWSLKVEVEDDSTCKDIGFSLLDMMSEQIDGDAMLEHEKVTAYVDDMFRNRFLNSTAAAWFDLAGYKYPGLRILEIGTGSTSTTTALLRKLSDQDGIPSRVSRYTYTEAKQDSLTAAKKTLQPWSVVDIAVLDTHRDVTAQGFVEGQYDVVFYSGLGQEAADVKGILNAAKKLLKSGGQFVAGTITRSQPGTSMILGRTTDWQTLPCEQWDTLLKSHGFGGIEASVDDFQSIELQEASMMISTSTAGRAFGFQDIVILAPHEETPAYRTLISKISTELGCRSLTVTEVSLDAQLRPEKTAFISFADLGTSTLESMSEDTFQQLKRVLTTSAGVIWVTDSDLKDGSVHPMAGIASGLFRTVRTEAPHLLLANLDLSRALDLGSETASRMILHVFDKTFAIDASGNEGKDNEFAESNGRLHVPRIMLESRINAEITKLGAAPRPFPGKLFQPGRPLKMAMGEPGILDTCRFIDQELFLEPLPVDFVDIRVNAVGVNFLDLMIALGQTPNKKKGFGSEVVGVIEAVGPEVDPKFKVGDTVVAIAEETFSTHVRIVDQALQHLPEGISEIEAVGCVIAYITAYCSLIDLARLAKGESVLIHAAAGGVGQAAIQLAQYVGAEIYATVGTSEKKTLLMEQYGIKESHIFNSRDLTFAKGVMRQTKDQGVDVILNSMHGEGLLESWNCLADFGRFVEIGKRDVFQNAGLEMKNFARNTQFIGFNLQQMELDGKYWRRATTAHAKVFDLLRKRAIRPLFPSTVYPFSQFEEAFRALQSGTISGKLILQAGEDEIVPVMPRSVAAKPLDPNSTFVLVGGLGGLGKALANYLISQGARHLAFLSRSGASNDDSKEFLKSLNEDGVQTSALSCNISDVEQLKTATLQLSTTMPRIKGVIQCAMVLRDSIFDNMKYDDWNTTLAAKIHGSWNLHQVLPKDMDFFILLSSASGIIGNAGQANYAAGCAYQDQLAHFRRRQGLAATSIDLGAVLGVGYIAETTDHKMQEALLDAMHIKEHEMYAVISAAIGDGSDGGHRRSDIPTQILTGIASGDKLRSLFEKYTWARDAKLSILRRMEGAKEILKDVDETRAALMAAMSAAEAAGIIEDSLVNRLAKALAISSEDINVAQPMHAYGVDSLVAVEVRNWLIRELQADISVFDILGTIPISQLSVKIVETSKLLASKFEAETRGNVSSRVDEGTTKAETIEVVASEKNFDTVELGLPVKLLSETMKGNVAEIIEEIGSASDSEDSMGTSESEGSLVMV